jgi:phospholipid/cholesterol/gamma-HCH transport system ATP-binding protein
MLDQIAQEIIARGDPRALRDQSDDPRVHAFFNRQVPPPDGPDARRAG